jgi:hypothetical protein
MTQRTYKIAKLPRGQLGYEIRERTAPDATPTCALWLGPGYKLDSPEDVILALRRAYGGGREDRSKEILGDEGLARAAAEIALHEPREVGGGDVRCVCGRFEWGSLVGWKRHLAYEILQAAARPA